MNPTIGTRRSLRAGFVIALAAPLLLIAGCSTSGQSDVPTVTTAQDAPGAGTTETAPQANDSPADRSSTGVDSGTASREPRDIVRNASVTVVVADPKQAGEQIQQATKAVGGYVSSVDTSPQPQPCAADGPCPAKQESTSDPTARQPGLLTITVRVPAAAYDRVLGAIRGLGDVAALSVQADDVTGQAKDLDARIVAQRASIDRMRQLLKQTDTIDEIVRVENELTKRQGDLEAMISERKQLADSVAMATITAQLVAADRASALIPPDTHWWDGPWNAFTQSWRGLLIALAALSPVLILLALGGIIALAFWRRRRTRPEPSPEATDDSHLPVGS